MFTVNADQSIHLTRGDTAVLEISALQQDETYHTFQPGDIVRFRILEKGDCGNVELAKDVQIVEETTKVAVSLSSEETRLGEIINKPKDYWYEVELNPETVPQTIIGYDATGPKVFRLYPEGADN